MPTTREQAAEALVALLQTLGPGGSGAFATVSRYVRVPQGGSLDTAIAQPALYTVPIGESTKQQGAGHLRLLTLHYDLYIYAKLPVGSTPGTGDGITSGDQVLNPLIEAIETTIAPPTGQVGQTLGGVVEYCWIEGETAKAVGEMTPDGQCFCAIPIKILIP